MYIHIFSHCIIGRLVDIPITVLYIDTCEMAAQGVVWLGPRPFRQRLHHDRHRLPVDEEGELCGGFGVSPHTRRTDWRRAVADFPFIQARLPEQPDGSVERKPCVVALLRIRLGIQIRSLLTELNNEERFLHTLYHRVSPGLHILDVLEAWAVCPPEDIESARAEAVFERSACSLSRQSAGKLRQLTLRRADGTTRLASAILRSWGCDECPTAALLLFPPLADLVASFNLSRLPWLASWRSEIHILPGFPAKLKVSGPTLSAWWGTEEVIADLDCHAPQLLQAKDFEDLAQQLVR